MTTHARRTPEELRASQRVARRLPRRFTVPVAGCSFRPLYPDNVKFLGELVADLERVRRDPGARSHFRRGYVDRIEQALIEGAVPVELRREPDNPADPLAVAIWMPLVPEVGSIGFIPATTSGCLAPLLAVAMDDGEHWEGCIPLDGVRIHPDHLDHPGIQVTVWRVR